MNPFRLLPEALLDLEEAVAWYQDQGHGLAAALLDEFDACVAAAIEDPGIGSMSGTTANGNTIRRYRLRRFHRYAVLMALINEVPTVVAFEHSSRRPVYWNDRVK